MTDGTMPSFIEILSGASDALKNGPGKDLPDGLSADAREKLEARLTKIDDDIASPLRGLIDDLTELLGEMEHASGELDSALTEGNNASDEYDEANTALEEFDPDDDENEETENDLQEEFTRAETEVGRVDESITEARETLIDAIDVLATHIGEIVKSALSPDISTGPGEIVEVGGLSPDITSVSLYQDTGEHLTVRVNEELVTLPNAITTIVGLSEVKKP